ncbi:hypothetical protein QFC24_005293 [Naganishia onofrii]|uniref:Uncharacterized protein n=1 Tax=Naganishia onofrii TaxID=1851511 RepID=A0ACC2X8G3_9TREE|nr:hypothetical protein QFC24_005293 [Naganishia onofrii]
MTITLINENKPKIEINLMHQYDYSNSSKEELQRALEVVKLLAAFKDVEEITICVCFEPPTVALTHHNDTTTAFPSSKASNGGQYAQNLPSHKSQVALSKARYDSDAKYWVTSVTARISNSVVNKEGYHVILSNYFMSLVRPYAIARVSVGPPRDECDTPGVIWLRLKTTDLLFFVHDVSNGLQISFDFAAKPLILRSYQLVSRCKADPVYTTYYAHFDVDFDRLTPATPKSRKTNYPA